SIRISRFHSTATTLYARSGTTGGLPQCFCWVGCRGRPGAHTQRVLGVAPCTPPGEARRGRRHLRASPAKSVWLTTSRDEGDNVWLGGPQAAQAAQAQEQ